MGMLDTAISYGPFDVQNVHAYSMQTYIDIKQGLHFLSTFCLFN